MTIPQLAAGHARRSRSTIRTWARWPRSRGSAGVRMRSMPWARPSTGSLLAGEAGIGKTRLLAEVLEDARGRGMQVAGGRAEELERTRPFGVLTAALGCAWS